MVNCKCDVFSISADYEQQNTSIKQRKTVTDFFYILIVESESRPDIHVLLSSQLKSFAYSII